jgi:hypothetical protein
MKKLFKGSSLVAAGTAVVVGASQASAAWTVDLTSVTTDVTTIGGAILALTAVIFGFRVVRRMIGR